MNDHLVLAFKNLRRRGIRSWLTLIGIFIGIAAVVSLMMLGSGLRTAALSQFGGSSTEIITIQAGGLNYFGAPGSAVVNPLQKADADEIEKISGVEFAVARNIETLKIEFNNKMNIGFAFDIPSGDKRKLVYDVEEIKIEDGRVLGTNERGGVLVGNDLANEMKNNFEKTISVGSKITINEKSFRVIGILEKSGSFTRDGVLIMDSDDLNEVAGNGKNADIISVKVKDKDSIDKVKEDIENLMRKRRNVKVGEEDFEVSTPQATLATVNSILLGIQIFIILVASISIGVGSVGIVNTMTTAVLERKKEIGIMKAIGARNSDVFYQFFFEAGLLGLFGGVIGIIGGIGIGFLGIFLINNFLGSSVALQFNALFLVLVLLGSFLIGSVSGVIPAMRAAKQNPVEALRE